MKLKHYVEDWDVDVIHAVFQEEGSYGANWHFQLVDSLRFYIREESPARPRIEYACFPEPTEYEIEQEGLGLAPPQQWRPHGPTDPCFVELVGGWHVKGQLPVLWEDLMRNAILSLNGEAAMALTFVLP